MLLAVNEWIHLHVYNIYDSQENIWHSAYEKSRICKP